MIDFGVVIIHYGRSAPTIRCVESVVNDSSRCSRRIIVVDNFGNLKNTDFPSEIKILQRMDNPGFGGGANIGVTALSGEEDFTAFLVLNNDAMLAEGALGAAREALRDDRVGAVGGPIRASDPNGILWYAGGNIRRLTGTVGQSRRESDARRAREVGFIPGTSVVIRAEAWKDVGGFDESFFLYNEDIDLCLRLRRRGWRLQFEPGMLCIHDLGESTGSGVRSALYLEQLSRTRLRPFRPRIYRLYLCVIHSVYNMTRMAMIFLDRGMAGRTQIRAIYRGHKAAMAEVLGLKSRPRES